MKITKTQIRNLIKEELKQTLDERKLDYFSDLVKQLRSLETNNSPATKKIVSRIENYISEFSESASRLRGLKSDLEDLSYSLAGSDSDIFPEEMEHIVEDILEMMDTVASSLG